MGIVFLAHEVALDRPVALKLLPAEFADREDVRGRFLGEIGSIEGAHDDEGTLERQRLEDVLAHRGGRRCRERERGAGKKTAHRVIQL